MPRVTDVINYLMPPELHNWFMRHSKAKTKAIGDEALRIGSAVDSLIQDDIRDGEYLVPRNDLPITNCMMGWEAWKKNHPDVFMAIVSNQMQQELTMGEITGHPDLPVKQLHRWGIIDVKCAGGIKPRYWTQTAIYSEMMKPLIKAPLPRFLGILRLDKQEATYEYREIKDEQYIQYEVSVFNAYLVAYQHGEKNREALRRILEKEILDVS